MMKVVRPHPAYSSRKRGLVSVFVKDNERTPREVLLNGQQNGKTKTGIYRLGRDVTTKITNFRKPPDMSPEQKLG